MRRQRPSRCFLPLAAATCALAAFAATAQAAANLRVTLEPGFPPRTLIKAGLRSIYDVTVRNEGPDTAYNVRVSIRLPAALSEQVFGCASAPDPAGVTLSCGPVSLPPGESALFSPAFQAPLSPGRLTTDASVLSDTMDPDLSDNVATLAFDVTDQPDLGILFWSLSRRVDPGDEIEYRFRLENSSFFPAQGVRFSFRLPPGSVFESADFGGVGGCDEQRGRVTCVAEEVAGMRDETSPTAVEIVVLARAPDSLRGGSFPLVATVASRSPDYDDSDNRAHDSLRVFRHYAVANTLDSGAGSLRATIEAANAECDRDSVACRIDFAIPGPPPENGWFTIRPVSALPPITATDLTIDGGTQTLSTGDTNRSGPEIEISGELCDHGSGLEIRSSGESLVAGLVINGFPENGLLIDGPFNLIFRHVIRGNDIGTDPTGTRAIPNGLRGIASFNSDLGQIDILDNVVSGNGRSGILVSGGASRIEGNRVGTQAAADEPLPNGASGIYLGQPSGCAVITGNVIGYNHDMGVAAEYSRQAAIQRNAIKNNRLLGIDFGLDGETPDDLFPDSGLPNRPLVESARYDAATGTTRIRGRFSGGLFLSPQADVYSNSGPGGQGETWIGEVFGDSSGMFELSMAGSLLGRYVTATTTLNGFVGFGVSGTGLVDCEAALVHTTSEFSRPTLVTR